MRYAAIFTVLAFGCAVPEPKPLEFLYRDECIEETKIMLYRLDAAITAMHKPIVYAKVHLDTLPSNDTRKSFLTPTILRDGVDLFGMVSTSALAKPPCRYSRDEVPSADAIQAKLLAP